VAGTVALLRSAHPSVSAGDVTRQVLATATSWLHPERYGAGLVNPYGAVLTAPPAAAAAATPAGGGSRSPVVRTVAWIVLWAVAAGVLLLLAWRVARHLRAVLAARAQCRAERDDPFWHPPADLNGQDQITVPFAQP
jgi:hypothetical protein